MREDFVTIPLAPTLTPGMICIDLNLDMLR